MYTNLSAQGQREMKQKNRRGNKEYTIIRNLDDLVAFLHVPRTQVEIDSVKHLLDVNREYMNHRKQRQIATEYRQNTRLFLQQEATAEIMRRLRTRSGSIYCHINTDKERLDEALGNQDVVHTFSTFEEFLRDIWKAKRYVTKKCIQDRIYVTGYSAKDILGRLEDCAVVGKVQKKIRHNVLSFSPPPMLEGKNNEQKNKTIRNNTYPSLQTPQDILGAVDHEQQKEISRYAAELIAECSQGNIIPDKHIALFWRRAFFACKGVCPSPSEQQLYEEYVERSMVFGYGIRDNVSKGAENVSEYV